MITSSSIPYISKALSEPQNISEADAESIDALTKAYPYFMPARYMDAAKKHKATPYNEELMAQMQLYSGNWILYSDFLTEVLGGADVEMATQEEEATTEAEVNTLEVPKETKEGKVEDSVTAEEPVTPNEEPIIISNETDEDNESDDIDDFNPVNTDFNTGDKPYIRKEKKKDRKPIIEERKMEEDEDDEALILPVYTDDYFLHQGVNVSNKIPDDYETAEGAIETEQEEDDEKSLMVVMSFAEWLNFFKTKKKEEEEEEEGQKALKTMWQREKLAAALEEEDEEIPENVFEMAVNSISKEDGLISESLANIHIKQGRYDKAIDMYRKLSLRNPQKKAYFARKIEYLIKEQEQ